MVLVHKSDGSPLHICQGFALILVRKDDSTFAERERELVETLIRKRNGVSKSRVEYGFGEPV